MKKSFILTVGILVVMLTLGNMAYGQNADSGNANSGSAQSMQQGADQGVTTQGSGQAKGAGPVKLSINTATMQELMNVPGIDRTIAQNIMDYRTANGPFGSVDDISKVEGLDKQKLDSMRKYIQSKLDLNVASADQLLRVPGIHQRLAQNIIQYREANGPFASVDDLNRIQGIDKFRLDMIKKYVQAGEKESSF